MQVRIGGVARQTGSNRLLKKVRPGLFQPRKAKMQFLLCFIFQTFGCLKNGGRSSTAPQVAEKTSFSATC